MLTMEYVTRQVLECDHPCLIIIATTRHCARYTIVSTTTCHRTRYHNDLIWPEYSLVGHCPDYIRQKLNNESKLGTGMRRNSSLHRANASNETGEHRGERESVYIAAWGNLEVDQDEPESESVNSVLHELSLLLLFGLLPAVGDSP